MGVAMSSHEAKLAEPHGGTDTPAIIAKTSAPLQQKSATPSAIMLSGGSRTCIFFFFNSQGASLSTDHILDHEHPRLKGLEVAHGMPSDDHDGIKSHGWKTPKHLQIKQHTYK